MAAKVHPFQAIAEKAARENGIPVPIFKSMISQESGWQKAVSNPSGATGIVQIHLPSHPDVTAAQANDPSFAIPWGARYLKTQYDRFGSWKLALAAYNAGPGAVSKYNGVPPYVETQRYVTNILAQASLKGGYPTGSKAEPQTSAPPSKTKPLLIYALPPGSPTPSFADLPSWQALGQIARGEKPTSTLGLTAGSPLAASAPAAPGPLPSRAPGPLPEKAPAAPTAKNTAWEGSQVIAAGLAQMAKAHGLRSVSEKRDTKMTSSGGVSDHWAGSKDAYAFDLSNGDRTEEMDAAAIAIANSLGVDYDGKGPLVLTVRKNGYRIQVLYRTQVGGNHNDHIHVGARRL